MEAPFNVYLESPTREPRRWKEQAQMWTILNKEIGGPAGYFPLTIKAVYVTGIIREICMSVDILLKHAVSSDITYLPACSVFASAIELLGRCINGNSTTEKSTEDLATGFRWLARPTWRGYQTVNRDDILIKTVFNQHTIRSLIALRNLAAHGQSMSEYIYDIDFEVLSRMPPLLANAIEGYWHELQTYEAPCNLLARATVTAFRLRPIFMSLMALQVHPTEKYPLVRELFEKFDWEVQWPYPPVV
jgi:hypothetical protein